jgi:hypothetical protein
MPRPKLDDADKLASLTVRIAQRQMARLQRITNTDGLPVQDHIRRALDDYADAFEAKFGLPMLPIGAVPNTLAATTPAAPAPAPIPTTPPPDMALVPVPVSPVAPAMVANTVGIKMPAIDLPEIDED